MRRCRVCSTGHDTGRNTAPAGIPGRQAQAYSRSSCLLPTHWPADSDSISSVTITCKTGEGAYKKHFLGISDNVTYFIEQLDPLPVGVSHYVVNFKPSAILPDVRHRQ